MLATASPSALTPASPTDHAGRAGTAARGALGRGAGTDGVEALARAWAAAWTAASPIAVAALYAPEAALRDPVVRRELHGQGEVATYVRRMARSVPDLRLELTGPPRVLASGQVLVAWQLTGHFAIPLHPSAPVIPGQPVRLDGVVVWQLRDGRIADHQGFYDVDELLPPIPPGLPTSLAG
jgi:steroid delta-isomerase-like uncharacterized protein